MTRIEIKNIGPIKNVDFELNKVNILMGPQSSGKSTIAKIISFCQWAEKRYLLDGDFEYDVNEQLLEFHRLSDNYFSESSVFTYTSDFITISYKGKKLKKSFRKKRTNKIYKKSKNIYIPSERNFVSVIPNLSKYKETNDNIMSFVYDWFTAKRIFNTANNLNILNLDIKFYTKSENDSDVLLLKNNKEIQLREGSSGLQSIIPLIVLIEYLTEFIYSRQTSNSVEEKDALKNFLVKNLSKIIDFNKYSNDLSKIDNLDLDNEDLIKIINSYQRAKSLERYHFTNFIIEEPEQNLFPTTQRDLINYLFDKMNDDKDHSLLLTTHSPYILYAINNCLMGYNVKNKIKSEEIDEIKNEKSWINPDVVSIWQVQDGTLVSVKDLQTKTVTKHYFNEITKDIMDEYFEMLSYYDYDTEN
jgi:ABC-type lipoprotein export system ATPase subunit